MPKQAYTFEDLASPDQTDLKKVRPFLKGEYLINADGTRSTERTMGVNIGGEEILVPSLWMTPSGPVDLSRNQEVLMRTVDAFEKRSGTKFRRFKTPEESDAFAKQRHSIIDAGNFPGQLNE